MAETQTDTDLLDKLVKVLRRAEDQELEAYLTHYQNSTSEFAPTALAAVQAEINARHENEKAA